MDAIKVTGRGVRSSQTSEFDDFVATCSSRLLRTAYLLTRDHGRAEDLLQTALAKTWLSWSRIDGEPTAYVGKTLHMSLDGGAPGELPCDVEQLSGRWIAYQLGPEYPAQGEHTLRIWLTRTSDDAQVAPPEGLLGAAVFSLPEPVATVAGHQVQEFEVDAGGEFRMTTSDESDAGDRAFSSTYPSSGVPVLVDWYTSSSSSGDVQVYVDGRPEVVIPLGEGGPGLVLAPGRSHNVRLRVLGEAPPDTLLGFAWREQVP